MKKIFAILTFVLFVVINYPSFADFPVRQSSNWDGGSVVAYNSTDHEYLAAWVEAIPILSGYLQQVKGQRIAEDGSMIGSVFTIFNTGTLPSVVYNEQINEYLVVACNTELYGQRVSNTGTLIGSQIQYNTSAANSRILYNSLAGTYLLIGSETAPANQLFTRKIGADGQPLGAIQNLGNSSEFSAAYAPISSSETPAGRYLVVFPGGQPIMLDSDGAIIYAVYDPYHPGVKYKEIPFTFGNANGGVFHVDAAFGYDNGKGTFLVVWGDNNNHYSNQEWTGIWGNYIDAYKIDYTTDYEIQNTTFPISAIPFHWAYPTDDFAGSWKPKVTYSYPGQKFMVTWRETPSDDPLNDAKVNHIRADKVWKAITYNPNVVISATNGNEDPKNPSIAASTQNPNALIIWEDSRNSASNNIDLYGNLYSIPAAPSITVIQPNGGENWKVATQHEIKWTCTNFTDPVMIEYSTDGGNTYASITNSTANDGSCMWMVPFKPSDFCIIRIKDVSDGDPADISDAVFSIYSNTKTVSNINDSGPGSFRQAILDANANHGKDTIVFNIPGTGVHTIKPATPLPVITDPVLIDGFSQPGSSPNANPISQACNAHLNIELDGNNGATGDGLYINGDSCVVCGMVINRFAGHGIVLSSENNVIQGNLIGTDVTGTTALKNGASGIIIFGPRNIIGGVTPESRNIISGNNHCGIIIDMDGNNNRVEGNFIGTQTDGSSPLGNGYEGVLIHPRNNFSNVIGGLTPESANIIAFNKNGVYLYESYESGGVLFSYNNKICINSIHNNEKLGITLGGSCKAAANDFGDIDTGPNNLQNYPVLTKVEDDDITSVSLYLNSKPNTKYRIDFYSNSEPDPSGYGEGEKFIGFTEVTTGYNGYISSNVSLGIKVLSNHFLTATATDPDGNTSEFSNSIPVAPNTPGGLNIPTIIGAIFKLMFDNVTSSGYTTAVTYSGGPSVPNNLIPLPVGAPVYYSISTTAEYTGNIEVELQYDNSILTADQEEKIKLNVYEPEGWKDITSSLDTANNIIRGITTHLSDFVITIPSSGNLNILVTNTQDTGVGSLRSALLLASESPGPDTVLFYIPSTDSGYNPDSGVWTIKPSATYNVRENTVIDGRIFSSSAGSRPGIEIDGTILKQSGMTGLRLENGASIRGLVVNRCQYGIWISGSNVTIEGCYIGTDAAGNSSEPNGLDGILITNGSDNVLIQNNLISGNEFNGVRAFGENTSGGIIRCNFIGTNSAGTSALSNGRDGVQLHASAHNFLVEENIISGNMECGVHLLDSATNCNVIINNKIGINAQGDSLPNGTFGAALFNGPKNNIIGPDNFIAYNKNCGVLIDGSDNFAGTVGNTITANRITCNGLKGINNFRGGNIELTPPVINSITGYLVSGTALPGARIEIFIDESDEGFFFIGADTADASGSFSYELPIQLPSLPNIAATATDTAGNTSEFSLPYILTSIGENRNKIAPAEFNLFQNYPNPFNPSTNIMYQLPVQSRVTLKIYDILGNEIVVLINEDQSAGVYNININTKSINNRELTSGVYFYQLRAGEFTDTKKFILLR